jgi:hypothetical protein
LHSSPCQLKVQTAIDTKSHYVANILAFFVERASFLSSERRFCPARVGAAVELWLRTRREARYPHWVFPASDMEQMRIDVPGNISGLRTRGSAALCSSSTLLACPSLEPIAEADRRFCAVRNAVRAVEARQIVSG